MASERVMHWGRRHREPAEQPTRRAVAIKRPTQRLAPQTVLRRLQKEAPFWLETLPRLPDLIIKNLETVSPQPAKNSRFDVKSLVLTAVGLGLVTTASGFPEQPLIFIAGAALLVLAVFSNKHQ